MKDEELRRHVLDALEFDPASMRPASGSRLPKGS